MIKSFDNYRFLGEVGFNGCAGSQWEKIYDHGSYTTTAKAFVPGRKPTRQNVIDAFKDLETPADERF